MKKHRNYRTKTTPNICPACGEKNGFLASKTPAFKIGVTYTDGKPCPACKPGIELMAQTLQNGGILVKCKGCESVTAVLEAPGFEALITQMPDGTRYLETQTCGQCSPKEGNDDNSHSADPTARDRRN